MLKTIEEVVESMRFHWLECVAASIMIAAGVTCAIYATLMLGGIVEESHENAKFLEELVVVGFASVLFFVFAMKRACKKKGDDDK